MSISLERYFASPEATLLRDKSLTMRYEVWTMERMRATGCTSRRIDVISMPEDPMVRVRRNGLALKRFKNQTPDLCMAAVMQDGLALQFVINQTDEICKAAVKEDGLALQFVINQTNEICKAAIERAPKALSFVKEELRAKYTLLEERRQADEALRRLSRTHPSELRRRTRLPKHSIVSNSKNTRLKYD